MNNKKSRTQKVRETRVAYRTRTKRAKSVKPRTAKVEQPLGQVPPGPSWQELQAWHAWKDEHEAEFVREYPGKYLAIWQKQVIAIGGTYGEAFDNAKRAKPDAVPLVTYVPTQEEMKLVPILFF
jgi:hypothetical protein